MRNPIVPAEEALELLKEGNRRFMANVHSDAPDIIRPLRLVQEQQPFAIILGCSDPRVPSELVFDQGVGDLFVIRVAGNIVEPSQVESIEFAVSQFGVQLVLVMGHEKCGAVKATLEAIERPGGESLLRGIVSSICPAVVGLVKEGETLNDRLLDEAVRANVQWSVDHLRNQSDVLTPLVKKNGLTIVGAEYMLKTGEVVFL